MRELIGSNIAKASTRATTMIADAPLPRPEPTPAASPQLASTESTPLSLIPPRVAETTAAIPAPRPGSSAPIKPIKVKTVAVKLVPPKRAASAPAVAAAPAAAPSAQGDAPATSDEPAAAPPAKAKETLAPTRHAARRGWVIQVGAFEDENEAKERLNSAQSTVPRLLEKADAYTERTTKGDKTYYRARFAGFEGRDQALAACRRLKRSDFACMPLKI
jgi:D-alanyl-D-alanine carboxypeptidase